MSGANGHAALLADDRPTIGAGLLGRDWHKERDEALAYLAMAYAGILDVRAQNHAFWLHLRDGLRQTLEQRFVAAGLLAPPWNEDELWGRVDLALKSHRPQEHVALVAALLTNYQERFVEHIRYRLNNHGNVHLEFTGPTGMGKSSCALALADWISPIPPERFEDYVSFDVAELPRKLQGKRPGETVVQDEYVATAGEGSRTFQSLFANLEDTLRASQVNLFVLSPRKHDHGTMQARLELVMWNPKRRFSAFLVWLRDQPHGLVAIPWAPDHLWAEYTPWKEANLKRSVAGQFQDNLFLARSAVEVCESERFVSYITQAANKPKKTDFESALQLFMPQMMSATQTARLAGFLHTICYNFERLEANFAEWFDVEPNDGMRVVARRCYDE